VVALANKMAGWEPKVAGRDETDYEDGFAVNNRPADNYVSADDVFGNEEGADVCCRPRAPVPSDVPLADIDVTVDPLPDTVMAAGRRPHDCRDRIQWHVIIAVVSGRRWHCPRCHRHRLPGRLRYFHLLDPHSIQTSSP